MIDMYSIMGVKDKKNPGSATSDNCGKSCVKGSYH